MSELVSFYGCAALVTLAKVSYQQMNASRKCGVYMMEHYSAFTNNEILGGFVVVVLGLGFLFERLVVETLVKLKTTWKEISAPETLVLHALFYIWKQEIDFVEKYW